MIKLSTSGNWDKTEQFLKKSSTLSNIKSTLSKYGDMGVRALSAATPIRTGETAASWTYEISVTGSKIEIAWSNSHKPYGAPVALLIQYGHGTRNGGYVQGIDYINPAMRPIFEQIESDILKEVSEY